MHREHEMDALLEASMQEEDKEEEEERESSVSSSSVYLSRVLIPRFQLLSFLAIARRSNDSTKGREFNPHKCGSTQILLHSVVGRF